MPNSRSYSEHIYAISIYFVCSICLNLFSAVPIISLSRYSASICAAIDPYNSFHVYAICSNRKLLVQLFLNRLLFVG